MTNSAIHTKHFFVQRSELEGRIDPQPYHIERRNILKLLEKAEPLLKLKNVVRKKNYTTSNITENDIYVGLENIKSDTGEYVETNTKESISSASIFKKGQILFPKLRPYLNKVYLTEFDGICSTEFHIFDSKSNLSNEFLAIYLRSKYIVNQTKHLMTGNTLPRLQTADIENLPVPDVDIESQQKIVRLYRNAFKTKQRKEEKVKELLDSINPYILDELGICLPTKDYSLEGKIFTVNNSDANGDRIDPNFYLPYYSQLVSSIQQKKYAKLSQIIKFSSESWNQKDYYEDTFPYIEISEINLSTGKIMNVNSIPIEEAPSRAKMVVKTDDIIVSLTRPHRGAITRIEKENNRSIASTGFAVLRKLQSDEVSKDYLFEVLRNPLVLKQLKQRSTGGNYPAITMDELGKVLIPIASKAKQDEIVKHINDLRERAKKLQEEAESLLTQAQSRIEKMILN